MIEPYVATLLERLNKLSGRKRPPADAVKELKTSLSTFPLVLQLLQSNTQEIYTAVASDAFLAAIAGALLDQSLAVADS